MIEKDAPAVPKSPSSSLDPLSSTGPAMQLCVSRLKEIFSERPISTRRAIFNTYLDRHGPGNPDSVKDHWRPIIRFALPYLCFMFRSGPFRDAYVLFGIDPRKESKWARYQTSTFYFRDGKDKPKTESVEQLLNERKNHLFTGKEMESQISGYLFEDILDPMLRKLIDESPLREKFNVLKLRDGLTVGCGWVVSRRNANQTSKDHEG
jgi:general transcription factor 3C polypeptide 5 (transcription factor C subunit 1)